MEEANVNSESLLNKAVHTPVEELNDEQKVLLTESWGALSDEEKVTYAEFAPTPKAE
jgi:hypothetical protein